jgi:hypothetical protein
MELQVGPIARAGKGRARNCKPVATRRPHCRRLLAARGRANVRAASGRLSLNLGVVISTLEAFVARAVGLESPSEASYVARAEQTVRALLPAGSPGTRFALPDRFTAWTQFQPAHEILSFDGLTF